MNSISPFKYKRIFNEKDYRRFLNKFLLHAVNNRKYNLNMFRGDVTNDFKNIVLPYKSTAPPPPNWVSTAVPPFMEATQGIFYRPLHILALKLARSLKLSLSTVTSKQNEPTNFIFLSILVQKIFQSFVNLTFTYTLNKMPRHFPTP